MRVDEAVIAKKYAVAFFNLYKDEFTEVDSEKVASLGVFVRSNKSLLMTLRVPSIDIEDKKDALTKIFDAFEISSPVRLLIFTLLDHGRLELLEEVIFQMGLVYKKINNIEKFHIITSHTVSSEQKQHILNFISSRTKAVIRSSFTVDPSLIVGIRIESSNYLWERSMRKMLTRLHTSLLEKGYDYDRKRN